LGARLLELRAWFRNVAPLLTYKTARDYAGSYQFITNEKAESELGYTHRSAREALGRGIRWYLEKGYVSDKAARRVRLELNAV
jgi:nucleoside-diphosphate-sugar epimerase